MDCWKYQQENSGLRLYGFVVLENHLHAVAEADDIPAIWARFKSYTARRIIELLQEQNAEMLLKRLRFAFKAHRDDRTHQFWQEGSHPQQIDNEFMLRQKLEYIHQNPIKRGYVDETVHWRWSSARNYDGKAGLIEVFTDW